jgi:hypothetical protein
LTFIAEIQAEVADHEARIIGHEAYACETGGAPTEDDDFKDK